MNRHSFLKQIATALSIFIVCCSGVPETFAANCSCRKTEGPSKKPNFVILFADDLGYSDVGYHGTWEVPTPNIDSIANNGVWFSTGYVTAPMCAPSRAGILTGRYPHRFGFESNPDVYRATRETKVGIPNTERTFGHRLKKLGYKTAFIGKHHSGKAPENNPRNLGFDYYYGFDNGASSYFDTGNLYKDFDPIAQEDDYLTDSFGREAVQFIENNKDNPFLVYVPFNAVHGPMQAPADLLDKYAYVTDPDRRKLMAMLDSLDSNVGKVLAKLRSHGLVENTLIFFISDNGGAEEKSNYSYNDPLRDIKGGMYEGGIRIPFCLQWKGTIPAGQKIDFPVITLDVLPTMIAAAGEQVDPSWNLDGINLLPYLDGQQQQPPERYLYWRRKNGMGWVIRDNTWKLVRPWGGSLGYGTTINPTELYNIAADMSETTDVYDPNSDVVNRLQTAYDSWSAEMMYPQWGGNSDYGIYVPLN